ncbi:triose-phosphate isomerase [Legionella yabuuchiae]|uniref:triose-phosphate isomerase n=1 Tax=Legionella yabuuchiae TaxID=376727 RepID=UPI0010567100|nr:triose-phosphate isomerase [Legionella yabuuchiae]
MRKKLVMGNWKMNGDRKEITALLQRIQMNLPVTIQQTCAVFPPAIYLPLVSELLADSVIKYGAQNVYPADQGALTGELSGPMLCDYNCRYVLVGHSERRHIFKEDEKFVAEKFHHVKEHGMIPVLCVGETLQERETGVTEQVLLRQLHAVVAQGDQSFRQCIVAYEPVWAIGTGQTATPEQAQNAHRFIRAAVAKIDADVAQTLPILYGGSVNDKNAQSLFEMPDVDGGLVGGASLNAQQFVEIVKCIN